MVVELLLYIRMNQTLPVFKLLKFWYVVLVPSWAYNENTVVIYRGLLH